MKIQITLEKADGKNVGDVAAFAFHGVRRALLDNGHPVSEGSDPKMFVADWAAGRFVIIIARDMEKPDADPLAQIVGVAVMHVSRSMFGVTHANPMGVFVLPKYRQSGVLNQLIEYTVKHLDRLRVNVVSVTVHKDSPMKRVAEDNGVQLNYLTGYKIIRGQDG